MLQAKDIFSDNLKSGGGNIEISTRVEYCIRKLQDRGTEALTWLSKYWMKALASKLFFLFLYSLEPEVAPSCSSSQDKASDYQVDKYKLTIKDQLTAV